MTPNPGAPPRVSAQLGCAVLGADPTHPADVCAWKFVAASYNTQIGNEDEYEASFAAPAVSGDYWYTYRFSLGGGNWTHCDSDGAGEEVGLTFSTDALGPLTVTP